MAPVFIDADIDDDGRRDGLYSGALYVHSADAASHALCAFARELIADAFGDLDPLTAQRHLPVEDYVAILSALKPRFIHHPRSKELVRAVLQERGCDLHHTYFDVPRLRSSTSHGYLTSGIAYAWHPHRDTWYSAPHAQLNWWTPVFAIDAGNGMAHHPDYFATPVPNTSADYNYYEWNRKHRRAAAKNVGEDTRPLPRPLEPIDERGTITLVTPVGGMQLFAGAQLHSSVPNTTGYTRFSIDFRTVHIGDIAAGRGAPNVDSECTGSSIRDFIRASDFAPMPETIVHMFDDGSEAEASELLYEDNARSLAALKAQENVPRAAE